MDIQTFDISGPVLLTPARYGDARGWFSEVWNQARFDDAVGASVRFVQDNQSYSAAAGTVRGLHYQSPPHAQGKLVRVLRGSVVDICVDARRGSPTYGRHVRVELSAENGRQFWVPAGFLHGFATLEPDTEVGYKVTDIYARDCEGGVAFDDPDLGLDWGVPSGGAVVSDKDRDAPRFADFDTPFGASL